MHKKKHSLKFSDAVEVIIAKFQEEQKIRSFNEAVESYILRKQQTDPQKPKSTLIEELEQYDCVFRTLLTNPDGTFSILCKEKHRIPLQACLTRVKRYAHFDKKCRPIGEETKPQQRWQQREQQTRPYKDGYMDTNIPTRGTWKCPLGKSPSFCTNNPCDRKQQCLDEERTFRQFKEAREQ